MYQIKGFISVKLGNSVASFLLTPDHAYLSPCTYYAIGIPIEIKPGSQCIDAKLFKLDEGTLSLVVKGKHDWLSHLINIALAQKSVLLSLDAAGKKIVGFTFPAN